MALNFRKRYQTIYSVSTKGIHEDTQVLNWAMEALHYHDEGLQSCKKKKRTDKNY